MLVGACWAGIAGVLKVTRGVSEVISTIMLNSIATGVIAYLLQPGPARRARPAANNVGTRPIPASGVAARHRRPGAGEIYGFIVVAVRRGVGYWFVLSRTRFGFDLRATGQSETAAVASGVRRQADGRHSMLLSGAIAGLVGMPLLLGDVATPTARTSRPASASPASPSRCSAATTRSASRSARCCGRFLDAVLADPRLRRHTPRRSSTIMQGVDRARRSSSPTSSSAASACAQQQRRVGAELAAAGRRPHRSRRWRHEHRPHRRRRPSRRPPGGAGRRLTAAGASCSVIAGVLVAGLVVRADHRRRTTSPPAAPIGAALAAGRADRARRPRRPVVRAGRRGQHRPRGHDDPRHLVRRLGRLAVRPLGRRARRHPRRRARRPAARGRHRHLRRRPHRLRCRDQHPRRRHHPLPVRAASSSATPGGGVDRSRRRMPTIADVHACPAVDGLLHLEPSTTGSWSPTSPACSAAWSPTSRC